MAYHRIMVAVDLGATSQVILQRADQLAKQFHAQLIVVTAIPDLRNLYGGTESKLQQSFSRELTEDAKDKLLEKCKRAKIGPHQTLVVHGDADHIIAGEALLLGVDLIVFGNHDRHGLDHFVGGFGLGLLYRAHCDLLAVYSAKEFQDHTRPLVAVAGEPSDEHLLVQARIHYPNIPLTLVHVMRHHLWSGENSEKTIKATLMQTLGAYSPVELILETGTPSTEIDHAAAQGGHGLIIMNSGRHSQLGWHLGSTAHNLLSRTHADVLLVRPQTSTQS